MRFDTKVIDGFKCFDPVTGASSIPKYQASTFNQLDFPHSQPYNYTRFGNPTVEGAEQAIAALENVKYGVAFSSGMGAISSVLLTLKAGDHVVLGKNIYGGTFQVVTEILPKFNVEYSFIDESNISEWESAIKANTRMLYIETPSNPLLTITDIRKVVEIANEHKLITVADNTFMTPYLQNPADLGVDIVIQSATKFLGGHSDILFGFAGTNNQELYEQIRKNQKAIGAIPGIEEAWLCMRGIKTLAVRMEKACNNAMKIAEFLASCKEVKNVYYPALTNHANHDVHCSQARGGGAVVSFELASEEKVAAFFKKVHYPIVAVSLGGVESILSYPWSMSHACMPEQERLKMGVTPCLIRLSVGIENCDDLLEDLNNALRG